MIKIVGRLSYFCLLSIERNVAYCCKPVPYITKYDIVYSISPYKGDLDTSRLSFFLVLDFRTCLHTSEYTRRFRSFGPNVSSFPYSVFPTMWVSNCVHFLDHLWSLDIPSYCNTAAVLLSYPRKIIYYLVPVFRNRRFTASHLISGFIYCIQTCTVHPISCAIADLRQATRWTTPKPYPSIYAVVSAFDNAPILTKAGKLCYQ